MLRASDLAIGYPGRRVGAGFTLQLRPGEVLALLGPNGSGKTTLLRTLLGLIPPQGGAVLLDERPLAHFSPRERALQLAYVPQVAASGFAFLARDVVLMGRTAHGGLLARPSARDHAVVSAALERLGIAALGDRPVTQISGGERQLVLVARALAQEPRCVVLDEPTASLDFGNQGHVLREIRRLAASGLAVLFTTHDPNHALRFADQVLLIRDGGTMAQGPVRELIDGSHLRRLYGTDIEELEDGASGRRAYLPG
ncbi:MAG TPA: ABC transporter ATP-binding protein [Burkholderiaceae bacterium]|nr:ABC transporter ATP-binding protein [Burkholderiaceae bacterium]